MINQASEVAGNLYWSDRLSKTRAIDKTAKVISRDKQIALEQVMQVKKVQEAMKKQDKQANTFKQKLAKKKEELAEFCIQTDATEVVESTEKIVHNEVDENTYITTVMNTDEEGKPSEVVINGPCGGYRVIGLDGEKSEREKFINPKQVKNAYL